MRLFVGLEFPDSVKDALLHLKTSLPTAHWVGRSQLHLTLFFIGETEKNLDVQQALTEIQAAPFDLRLAQVGRFPPPAHAAPRVLWVGVQPHPALLTLQQRVTAALTALGFEAEDRPYSPHITLARFKTRQPLPALDRFLSQHASFQLDPIPVKEFVLFSSQLTPQGAHYHHEAVYPLVASD